MIIALVKFPVALREDIFNLVNSFTTGLERDPNGRVYEYTNGEFETTVHLMGESDYYEDECFSNTQHKENHYFSHKRPTENYVVLRNNLLLVDLEKLYSLTQNIHVEIIKALVID